MATQIKVLCGKTLTQLGFGLLLFSSIFVWVFGSLSNFGGLFIPAPDAKAAGVITAITVTNTEVNGSYVDQHTASFVAQDGKTYTAEGYAEASGLKVGDAVEIAYAKNNPTAAAIVGQRTGSMPGWVLWIIAPIPAIGLILLGFGFYSGLKSIRLLTWGEFATGKLLRKEETNVTINDMPVMKMYYEVNLPGNRTFEATAQSHRMEKFEEDTAEPLLYEQNASGGYNAVILDALPGKTQFDNQGNVQAATAGEVVMVLVLPVLFILVNTTIAFFYFTA